MFYQDAARLNLGILNILTLCNHNINSTWKDKHQYGLLPAMGWTPCPKFAVLDKCCFTLTFRINSIFLSKMYVLDNLVAIFSVLQTCVIHDIPLQGGSSVVVCSVTCFDVSFGTVFLMHLQIILSSFKLAEWPPF